MIILLGTEEVETGSIEGEARRRARALNYSQIQARTLKPGVCSLHWVLYSSLPNFPRI
jgi:hypothetical protein